MSSTLKFKFEALLDLREDGHSPIRPEGKKEKCELYLHVQLTEGVPTAVAWTRGAADTASSFKESNKISVDGYTRLMSFEAKANEVC